MENHLCNNFYRRQVHLYFSTFCSRRAATEMKGNARREGREKPSVGKIGRRGKSKSAVPDREGSLPSLKREKRGGATAPAKKIFQGKGREIPPSKFW